MVLRALVLALSLGASLLSVGVSSGLGETPVLRAPANGGNHKHLVYGAKQACPSFRHPVRGHFVHPTLCREAAPDKPKRAPKRRRHRRKPAAKRTAAKRTAPKKRAPTHAGQPAGAGSAQSPASSPAPAPNPPSVPSQPAGASAWDEPALVDPTVVTLSDSDRSLQLDQSKDYIVRCPSGQFDVSGKITIWGGHNVVFQDCDEYVTNPSGDWAGYLEDQTGTVWVHDVHFGGAHLTGGVQLQEPGATVVMRDVLFDTVYGSYQTNHAECVQSWSGPARFLIDGLQCSTTYQGLFLLPNQWDSTTLETTWDFRNLQVDGDGAYDLWLGDVQPSWVGSLPVLNLENVYDCGTGEPRDYDGTSDGNRAWAGVKPCSAGGQSEPVWSGPDGSVTGIDDGISPRPITGEAP